MGAHYLSSRVPLRLEGCSTRTAPSLLLAEVAGARLLANLNLESLALDPRKGGLDGHRSSDQLHVNPTLCVADVGTGRMLVTTPNCLPNS